MFTRAEFIVALWFLPVLLQVILPLTVLFFWLLTKPFRRTRQYQAETGENKRAEHPLGYKPPLARAKH